MSEDDLLHAIKRLQVRLQYRSSFGEAPADPQGYMQVALLLLLLLLLLLPPPPHAPSAACPCQLTLAAL